VDVAQYAYWLLHRELTPKQQTGIPAPNPPLDSNYLTFVLMAACTALVFVWFVWALPEFLLLVAFLLTTIWYFVIQPVAIMVLLPEFVEWSWEMIGGVIPSLKEVKSEGTSGSFTIKIAAAQGFFAQLPKRSSICTSTARRGATAQSPVTRSTVLCTRSLTSFNPSQTSVCRRLACRCRAAGGAAGVVQIVGVSGVAFVRARAFPRVLPPAPQGLGE
jgi:hypothetical protein